MADEADFAEELNELYLTAALAHQAQKLAPQSHPDFDGHTCIECGCEIPHLRLAQSRIRCVDCQTEIERGIR